MTVFKRLTLLILLTFIISLVFVVKLPRSGQNIWSVENVQYEFSTTNPHQRFPVNAGATTQSLDLRLPEDKLSAILSKLSYTPRLVEELVEDYAIGSSDRQRTVYKGDDDRGLFQAVYEAWKNHWNLRTSPEDWWMPVAMKIAKAVDGAALQEEELKGKEKPVRQYFVNHDGKENIQVEVPVDTIYQVDYKMVFDEFAKAIQSKIKRPDFAAVMQNDFSSSAPAHAISSQVNLMAGMQQFFTYEMALLGCGIKGLEMLGTQEDWDDLLSKFQKLRSILRPIQENIGIGERWLQHVEMVYKNLAKTFAETELAAGQTASDEVAEFWMKIMMEGVGIKYGISGYGEEKVKAYNGWLIMFLLETDEILVENVNANRKMSGLNEVPMKITMANLVPVISDESTLKSGIMGFEVHSQSDTFNQVPSVQPHHMWALTLPSDSPLRGSSVSEILALASLKKSKK